MYYLRTRPAVDAIKFTLNVEELLKASDSHDTASLLNCLNKTETNLTKQESSSIENGSATKKVEEAEIDDNEACVNCSG